MSSKDASAAYSNRLHHHPVLLVTPSLLPVRLAQLAQQTAHWDFAVNGNADHGAVFLHGERIDASCAQAVRLWDVNWEPGCVMVYPEGKWAEVRICMLI